VVDRVTNQIERYMDLLSARQKLVASNIANVDTPGYTAKDIDFQFEFHEPLTEGQAPNVDGKLPDWSSRATGTT
jgi:flagellar basal-body rod protein FlgB